MRRMRLRNEGDDMAGRRGHGEGSIYRRESDGMWCCVVDIGRVNGKPAAAVLK